GRRRRRGERAASRGRGRSGRQASPWGLLGDWVTGLRTAYAYSPEGGRRVKRWTPRLRKSGGRDRGQPMPALDPRAALVQAGPYRAAAERALDDRPLERAEALAVLRSPDGDLPAVLSAAFAVRARHFGRRVKLCVLKNARSGLCPEDCGYCSQSAVSSADIDRYRLRPVPELVAAARQAVARGARRYCMVVSARGPSAADIAHFERAARAIRAELPALELCVSLGLLGDGQAEALRAAALFRLTNPRAEIRAAGGRERSLGDAQPLALLAANSIFVDGYLTTPGQAHQDAVAMIESLGFEVESPWLLAVRAGSPNRSNRQTER